jgi:hypothetical protein
MSIKKAQFGGHMGWVAHASATIRATVPKYAAFSFCDCRACTLM